MKVFPSRSTSTPKSRIIARVIPTYGAETSSVTSIRSPCAVSGPSISSAVRYWDDSPASRVSPPPSIPAARTVSGWWPSASSWRRSTPRVVRARVSGASGRRRIWAEASKRYVPEAAAATRVGRKRAVVAPSRQ